VSTATAATTATALAGCVGVSVIHGRGHAQVHALRSVDLDIAEGERLSLWGRSGSGKTTLLHVLGGLIEPTDGMVHWRGEPLSTLDAAARAAFRAHSIGYIFQGAKLLPHFTAYENVVFARLASGTAGEDPARLLELVGLSAKLDHLPGELSGGEAQRVAIARALAQRPELLLCDEPTGQLDHDTGERVLDLVDALHDELSFALVVATHDADVAARYARTVELLDGAIAGEAGTT
jgi:putative ABC transport system ATP-binding protein